MRAELDWYNYATNVDLKNATNNGTSKFPKKVDLASLNLEFDKLDIDKLETTPVDLNKVSDAVKKTKDGIWRLYIINKFKNQCDSSHLHQQYSQNKLITTQTLVKLKSKLLIMSIVQSIFLLKKLIS